MAGVDGAAVLSFTAGVLGTIGAFGAKYLYDYRLGKRRLELDERAAMSVVLGNRPGQLRRASLRMKDRVDGFFRESDSGKLPDWLTPSASGPVNDGYYLRSTVQRLFSFVSWASLVQQAIDSLPAETLRARTDLQRQYALIELAWRALSNIDLLAGYPGYVKDEMGYHIYTGTLDEVADLGVAAYSDNSNTIPTAVFGELYDDEAVVLMACRQWFFAIAAGDHRARVILARFACLGAILDDLMRDKADPSFRGRVVFERRLKKLTAEDAPAGYDFASRLPAWLDKDREQLMQARTAG